VLIRANIKIWDCIFKNPEDGCSHGEGDSACILGLRKNVITAPITIIKSIKKCLIVSEIPYTPETLKNICVGDINNPVMRSMIMLPQDKNVKRLATAPKNRPL